MYSEGETINGYYIEQNLNTGGFALSYKAVKGDKNYFLKEYISPKPIEGKVFDDFVELQNEIKERLKQVSDITLQVVDIFVLNQTLYVVYEFLKGEDLSKILMKNKLSYELKWMFLTIFWGGLSRIHSSGIIHVDLKPEQVYLKFDPSNPLGMDLQLCDFDMSYVKTGDKLIKPFELPVFTPAYQSPEHIKGLDLGFRSDVFTAAIISYKVLLGKHPFLVETDSVYIDNVNNEKNIGRLRDFDKRISTDLSNILLRALSNDINKRPEARDVWEILTDEVGNNILKPWVAKQDIEVERKKDNYITVESNGEYENDPDEQRTITKKYVNKDKLLTDDRCSESGSKNVIRVNFVATNGKKLQIYKETIITRNLCKSLGSDYKWVDARQFKVWKDSSVWKVKGFKAVHNTLYKNNNITNVDTVIENGEFIKIGDLVLKIEFILA